MAATTVPTSTLGCGPAMLYRRLEDTNVATSVLGLGGSVYGQLHVDHFDEEEATRAFKYAIDRGINYIDTAYWYGQGASERFIGNALKGIPRERHKGSKIRERRSQNVRLLC